MLIIKVQVRFDELFSSSAQLGFCMSKKGKAIDGLLDDRFPAIYLIDVFLNGVCDSSDRCHALHNGCLHTIFEKVGLVT